jgi:hypothetical protein
MSYRFDRAARSERYFVASLLSHLLLTENFTGLKSLFKHVFGDEQCSGLPDDFELVSELDPLRDGSIQNIEVKKLYQEFKRVAVPDLFLRWSQLCLVIEAKFFTDPALEELKEQIRLRRDAIEKVKPFTLYQGWTIKFAALTTKEINLGTDIHVLTWEGVLSMMEKALSHSENKGYAIKVIQDALARANQEMESSSGINFKRLKFDEIMSQLPDLIQKKKIYIGFTGGIEAFSLASEEQLRLRSHYKVSDIRWSDNWITLDQFLRRVFEVRGYFEKYDDRGE